MRFRSMAMTTVFILLFGSISSFSMSNANAATVVATGTSPQVCDQEASSATGVSVIRISNGDCVVSFTNTSAANEWTVPNHIGLITYLVVGGGGGGGGGYDNGGGGGGGGGMVLSDTLTVTPNQKITLSVGAGGTGGVNTRPSSNGTAGAQSTFFTFTALGGGFGYESRNRPGGDGVAGTAQLSNISAAMGGNGTGSATLGGGGGGATANGSGSTGGAGLTSLITGTSTIFGKGGNGAPKTLTNGTSGTVNTGNGGNGGGNSSNASGGGGTGGSGIVVIRYTPPSSVFEATNYTSGSTTWSNSISGGTAGTAPTGGMTKNATPNAVIFSGRQGSNSDQLTSSIGSTSSIDTVTVEMWLKLADNGSTDNASGSMLFSWAGSSSYNVYHYQDQIGFNNFGSQLYGVNSASYNNSWKHYVFVMTDTGPWSSQKIYVDGVLQSSGCIVSPSSCSAAQTRSFHTSGNFVLMDNQTSSNTWNARGQIGLVRIYTQELSQPTIQNLYNLTSSTYQIPVPVNSILPAISGTTSFGSTLTSSEGTWSNTPTSFTYQWLRASTSGGTYSPISGATNATYVLDNADVNQYLKVAVTANNNGGSATETSTATSQISTAASSASLSVDIGTLVFRQSKTISATASVSGRLTFRANNVIIPGCKNLVAVANVSKSCSYKPARRGNIRITVTLVPTSGSFRTSVTESDNYFVTQRSGRR
jgi:hypothetical protein